MFRALVQTVKFFIYGLLIVLGVTFAVSNRRLVDITLFPLPYKMQLPLFVFAIIIFAVGCILGWIISRWAALKKHHVHREMRKRADALENELVALRSEKSLPHVTLPPQ